MRRLTVACLAAQLLALPALAQTPPAAPAGPAPNITIPEITAKDTAKLPAIEAVAPSKTNTGMTTAPTATPADSKPLPPSPAPAVTESQAVTLIEAAGYRNVTGLAQDKDGTWRGKADKGAVTALVAVDAKGNVSTH